MSQPIEPAAAEGPEHAGTATHAETLHHEEGGNPLLRPEPGVAIWTFVTFAILFVVLKKLAWGPMLATLDQREKAIRDSLAEAEKARAAVSSSLQEQERMLAEARREAQDLLARSRADAERAREEVVAKARSESEKIVEAGRRSIELEKQAALHEVRTAAVDLVLSATGRLLKERVDDQKSRELVRAHLKEIEESGRAASRPS